MTFDELQKALTEKIVAGGGGLWVPNTGDVNWPRPLNFRGATNVELRFERGYRCIPRFSAEYGNCPVVDMVDTQKSAIRNLRMKLPIENPVPACGLLLARSGPTLNTNYNVIDGCDIEGAFGNENEEGQGGACVMNIGSEIMHMTNRCSLRFKGQRGGAYYTSAFNTYNIRSPYGPVMGPDAPVSNAGGTIDGSCHFACDGPTEYPDERYVIGIGSRTGSLWVRDVYVTAKTFGSLRCVFWLGDRWDTKHLWAGVNNVCIENVHDEATAAEYFAYVQGPCRGVVLRNIANVQAGMPVGYGDVYGMRHVDGLRLENVQHRPYAPYWTGRPLATHRKEDK